MLESIEQNYPSNKSTLHIILCLPSCVISPPDSLLLELYILWHAANRVKAFVNCLHISSALEDREGWSSSAVSVTALHSVSIFLGWKGQYG